MVKELACVHGDEGSIPFYVICKFGPSLPTFTTLGSQIATLKKIMLSPSNKFQVLAMVDRHQLSNKFHLNFSFV
jgi:hypothetical protein